MALLPGGDLAVAPLGCTNPLLVLPAGAKKAHALLQSALGLQDVLYSPKLKALVTAEQGGRIWLLSEDGEPKAMLGDDAGTTAYRMSLQGSNVVVARMNRVVQVLSAR